MSGLTHEHFARFFHAVWGVEPFPWQEDLLRRLATGKDPRRDLDGDPGVWPAVLDLPTGSGKTAALDIAVFHLALEANKREGRRAAVRVAFVVDRRLIVDDAYARAERLADVLGWSLLGANEAGKLETDLEEHRPHLVEVLHRIRAEPSVQRVASRLCELAGAGQPPLIARRLRGGVPREDDWARTPVQPTILCSTVDQVGSRLLFRGYGVGDTMKPIHAGLLGSDCRILLDEAHLAEPFRQTLEAVGRLRGSDRKRAPFGFAVLTATPAHEAGQPKETTFALSPVDEAHPILARRIAASKPARLVEIANKQGIDAESRRADALAEETQAMIEKLRASGLEQPAVAVVVNRVARARAVFERLEAERRDAADIVLLIGPARSVDRDDRARALEPIRTLHFDTPRQLSKPLIVVATQTIEAGVDIDFDGLVTEAAALDALRQRFGRLNRAGRSIGADAAKVGRPDGAQAVILAHKEDIATDEDANAKADAVYGGRIKRTWTKLQQLAAEAVGIVDFGIQALKDKIDRDEADKLSTPTKNAPVLMPAYAHLWAQTAPIPNADPDVVLFLHGPDRSPASVQIVWRADIDEQHDLRPAMGGGPDAEAARGRLVELLKLVPPRAVEAVDVPLWAARAWLDRVDKGKDDFSDAVERGREPEDATKLARRALRWAGEDSSRTKVIYGSKLRNGDLIVVPAGYGGCDEWGWKPTSDETATDVADAALWPYRGRRFAVRVTPELVVQSVAQEQRRAGAFFPPIDEKVIAEQLTELLAEHESNSDTFLLQAVLDWCETKHQAYGLSSDRPANLDDVRDACLPPRLKELRDQCKGAPRSFLRRAPKDEHPRGIVFFASRGIGSKGGAAELAALPATESNELSVSSDKAVPLDEHCGDVRSWAEGFAVRAGLSHDLCSDVALAGLLHDFGKADGRFQRFLFGGDPYGPDITQPLAKSGQRRLPEGAWDRSGLPKAWRHEALSVTLARAHPKLAEARDKLLVLWLIGTHHGHGRPLFPHADPRDAESRELPFPRELGGKLSLNGAEPGPQSLAFDLDGLDWAHMFDVLKERYGIWGLARLEAFVRLADHRASEAGAPPSAAGERREAAE